MCVDFNQRESNAKLINVLHNFCPVNFTLIAVQLLKAENKHSSETEKENKPNPKPKILSQLNIKFIFVSV